MGEDRGQQRADLAGVDPLARRRDRRGIRSAPRTRRGAREWIPEDYDKEITNLQQDRDQVKNLLEDPEQQKQRRTRRAQIVGDYVTRSVSWQDDHMDNIRQVAAKTDEGWLFKPRLLQLDGWSHDDGKGNWRPPKS